jgi:hypothetical protein
VIAEALVQLRITIADYPRQWFSYSVQFSLLVALVYPLDSISVHHEKQEIKPLLAYLQQHKQNQDKIYLYHWAEPAFRYYAAQYELDYAACHLISPIPNERFTKEINYFRHKNAMPVVDVNQTQCFLGVGEHFHSSLSDLAQLQGQGRVWFVFTHYSEIEKNQFIDYLNRVGQSLDVQHRHEASLYLYEL